MTPFPRWLLLLDSTGGLAAGVGVLVLSRLIAGAYGLPHGLILFLGAANLSYGTFSGLLAVRAYSGRPPPTPAIRVLAAANVAWGFVCAGLVVTHAGSAGPLGLAHLTLEGAYVAGLGVVEALLTRRRG